MPNAPTVGTPAGLRQQRRLADARAAADNQAATTMRDAVDQLRKPAKLR
jgi:hypothetical protein